MPQTDNNSDFTAHMCAPISGSPSAIPCPLLYVQKVLIHLTKCQKIGHKYVLHLLKYRFAVYLSKCYKDLRYILGISTSRHHISGVLPE